MSDSDNQEDNIAKNLNKTQTSWNSKTKVEIQGYSTREPRVLHLTGEGNSASTLTNGKATKPAKNVLEEYQFVEECQVPDINPTKVQTGVSDNQALESVVKADEEPFIVVSRKHVILQPAKPVDYAKDKSDDHYAVEQPQFKTQCEPIAQDTITSCSKPSTPPNTKAVEKEQVYRFDEEITSAPKTDHSKIQFESKINWITPEMDSKQPVKKPGSNLSSQNSPNTEEGKRNFDDEESPSSNVELFKSSEPVYDEMVGDESVKDRLQKYKSITECSGDFHQAYPENIVPPKPNTLFIRRESASRMDESSASTKDIIRSPPAGTREQVDYVPSVDLREAKALYEVLYSPRSDKSVLNSFASTTSCKPSNQTSSHSSTNIASSKPISSGVDKMSDDVKPPPGSTKDTKDYVPSVNLSSIKNMFERLGDAPSPSSGETARKQLCDEEREKEDNNAAIKENTNSVPEGFYETREGIICPPTAGTKERPNYNLSADFLRSRAAMFNSPTLKVPTPRNGVNV